MSKLKSILLFAALVASAITSPAHAATSTQSIAIPAYEYPTLTALWGAIDAAGSQVPFVIVNPASGPGASAISDYTNRINANTSAGNQSIGYVDTNYQTRPVADVMNDIDMWYTLYPGIQGIFFDRVSVADSTGLCYTGYLYNYAKIKHANDPVIQNFGTYTSPAYEPYGDIFVNAEMDHALYQTWTLPADGFQDNPAYSNRFWHLIHTTDPGDFSSTLTQTRNNNAGWVYITDDALPNPYDAAPTYWNTELTDVDTLPSSSIPNRGVTDLPAGCLDVDTQINASSSGSTTSASVSITNQSNSYAVPTPTTVSFSLPNGVTPTNMSGTGWTCADTTCTYTAPVDADSSASALLLEFTADCSYQSGDVALTTVHFPQTTTDQSVSVDRPSDCPTPPSPAGSNLADTGSSINGATAIVGILTGAGLAAAVVRRLYR